MNAQLLTRAPHTPRAHLALWPDLCPDVALPLARAHEICGPARQFLAVLVAGVVGKAHAGPIFWIAPDWAPHRLNPEGMVGLADPGRFHFVTAKRGEDLLWALEEVLRSGAAPLAVLDLPEPPGMTAVRRLHLAAETGAAETGLAPLGIVMTPGQGGAPGIETRWHMAQAHHAPHIPSGNRWQLTRMRARTAPPRRWMLAGRPGAWRLSDGAPQEERLTQA